VPITLVSGTSLSSSSAQPEVSTIQEDTGGYFYTFHPPGGREIRVNITKGGYCSRSQLQSLCNIHTCYADLECPEWMKCCPSGCSLGCLPIQNEPVAAATPAPQASRPPRSAPRAPTGLVTRESNTNGIQGR